MDTGSAASTSVVHCLTGFVFLEAVDERTSHEAFRRAIERHFHVNAKEQVLLVGPACVRLTSRKPLFPQVAGRRVYVYDHAMLTGEGVRVVDESSRMESVAQAPEYQADLQPPGTPTEALLGVVRGDADRAVFAAEAVASEMQRLRRECTACVAEQALIQEAVQAALRNAQTYTREVGEGMRRAQSRVRRLLRRTQPLLTGFEGVLERLRRVPLHPALRSEGRATLLDCLPQEKLLPWRDYCQRTHDHLAERAARAAEKLDALARSLAEQERSAAGFPVDKARDLANSLTALVHESQQLLLATLEARDAIAATATGAGEGDGFGESGGGGGGGGVGDGSGAAATSEDELGSGWAVLALTRARHTLAGAQQHTRSLLALHAQSRGAASDVLGLKRATVLRASALMRNVAELQTALRAVRGAVSRLEALAREHEESVKHLEHVRDLPAAYAHSILDVIRRQHQERAFVAQVHRFERQVTRWLRHEAERRDRITAMHHLPSRLIPGILRRPLAVSIHLRDPNPPQRAQLPEVDYDEEHVQLLLSLLEESERQRQERAREVEEE
eukprot:CAMPEP_0196781462 /NCGR_PEP_ID=MMETSP1104-20130614/9662_1 /TAXON_ID=33652 /ORGANISM="Cafeteria sp., Strain Caron Lab Isolate" /LENGTH=559 /DNA_ID=CAMNT_0042151695 /DNA_START=49 /DNA_END=1725 /DNA_ORIENTATION=-